MRTRDLSWHQIRHLQHSRRHIGRSQLHSFLQYQLHQRQRSGPSSFLRLRILKTLLENTSVNQDVIPPRLAQFENMATLVADTDLPAPYSPSGMTPSKS